MPSLSEELKNSLDSPFTLKELENVIYKSKLNKSSGPSGFTNAFFKYFLYELYLATKSISTFFCKRFSF